MLRKLTSVACLKMDSFFFDDPEFYNGIMAESISSGYQEWSPLPDDGEVRDDRLRAVVLLGASNLAMSFPLVKAYLEEGLGEPLHILAALGHGRSYGMWSRVAFRALPGITQCGLWEELKIVCRQERPPLAMLTDIGNDLLYGVRPEEITAWVESCLKHLADRNADIVLTLLPIASITRISAGRYYLTRSLFFPTSTISWPTMQQRMHTLNDWLRQLGDDYSARIVDPPLRWYGFDPIHIRPRARREAWQHLVSQWRTVDANLRQLRVPWSSALRYWRMQPAERRLFGWRRTAAQPVEAGDRMRISLY